MPWSKLPYLCVFVVLIAASFGLPIPEDIPLLTGGYLCHRGLAHLPIMILVGMVGVLTGDLVLFSLGRRWGHHIVDHRFVRRLVNPTRLLLAENLFERHGIKIIFAGRFLPGLRPMIFVASGVLKVSPWTFIAVNGFAACISVPILILLGNFFGQNLTQLEQDVRTVGLFIAVIILAVGLVAFTIYWHRRQKQLLAAAGLDGKIDAETLSHLPPGGHLDEPEIDAVSQGLEYPQKTTTPAPAGQKSSPSAAKTPTGV